MEETVNTGVYISLAGYFVLMIAIGVYAFFKQQKVDVI